MEFSLIAAVDSKMGIGKNARLPWRLPKDLKYFHDTTTGGGKNAVIMGRTTWESIPENHRPLVGRFNIVLSRSQKLVLPADAKSAQSLNEALLLAKDAKCEKIFVIGGAQIFADAINHPECEEIYLTDIQGKFDCDTFFPEIDPNQFKEKTRSKSEEENGISFQFALYKRQ